MLYFLDHPSGRPKTARTVQNVSAAEELALRQSSQPNIHCLVHKIVIETGIHLEVICSAYHPQRSSSEVFEEATSARADKSNCANRPKCARMLLKIYPDDQVNFIWFTDEKLFTVAASKNSQNDCL